MQITERIESAVDRVVGLFSPAAGLRRRHHRLLARNADYRALFDVFVRNGYRAASSGNNTPWTSNHNSTADQEIAQDLPTLRNRSRELERDDSIGSGLIGTFVSNVIGTGMSPQCKTGDSEKDSRIEAAYYTLAAGLSPDMDLTQAERQQMVYSRSLVDGEVLVRRVKRGNDPVWFQILEADRLQGYSEIAPVSRNEIRQGVERDRDGKIVAYWIMNQPQDAMRMTARGQADFTRVPKSEIMHLKRVKRPGQSRGVPFCHAILQDIRDLDLLMVAALKRVQIACLLAVFIKSTRSADIIPGQQTTSADGGKKLDQDIEPGMMMKLNPDESIETLVPNFPVPEFGPFVIMLARRIGTAVGIPWQMVLKDFSDSTYSSARTDMLEARRTFTALQKWFAETYLTWEWTEVLKDGLLRGEPALSDVSIEDIASVEWIANGWQWVDPMKEAAATELELKMGTMTLRDVASSRGKDWQEQMNQKLAEEKYEQEQRKKLGLPPKLDPLAVNQPKAAEQAAASIWQDEPKRRKVA
jgi:lambda family phage portal protein